MIGKVLLLLEEKKRKLTAKGVEVKWAKVSFDFKTIA